MGSTYVIDELRRLVRSRSWGVMTAEDVRDQDCRLRADAAFSSSYQQLTDLRGVEVCSVTHDAIRESAGVSLFDPGVRRAIVVASEVMFGLSRMFASYADGRGQVVAVFREMVEAEAWLSDAIA